MLVLLCDGVGRLIQAGVAGDSGQQNTAVVWDRSRLTCLSGRLGRDRRCVDCSV